MRKHVLAAISLLTIVVFVTACGGTTVAPTAAP